MKNRIGEVIRTSCKTALVKIERVYNHAKYKKLIKVSKNYMVHDDIGVEVGDSVSIALCKPISKRKRHIVKEKL